MHRLLSYVTLLALFGTLAFTVPASSQAADCQEVLPHGTYTGTLTGTARYSYRPKEGDEITSVRADDSGQLTLNVGCAVSASAIRYTYNRTISFLWNGNKIDCVWTDTRGQTNAVLSTGTNGQPRIDLSWGPGTISNYSCPGDPPPMSEPATWQLTLGGPPQGRTIAGDFRLIYGEDEIYETPLDLLLSDENITVLSSSIVRTWSLTRAPQPSVQGLSNTLRQNFLAGIPVTNRYTATVGWDEAAPGAVRLFVGGQTLPMNVTGNSATLDLPLTSIPGTGTFPLSVEAELDGRVERKDGLGSLTLVPVPPWARSFNLQPVVAGDHVRYSGVYALPEKPLDAHVVLPSVIPYVGGTWGLLPTQLRLELAANSLGTREPGGLTVQGGFGLGKRSYTLQGQGAIYGTISAEALSFESDELTLATPPISFREQVGLVTVIPGASTLFDVPVIGDLLKGLNSALGISAEIHGSARGSARLAVVGSDLQITQGGYAATLGVLAAGGIDTPVASLSVSGGGDGSLRMQMVPVSRVEACQILLSFQAKAAALGFSGVSIQRSWPVYSCTAAASSAGLLAVAPTEQVGMVYGGLHAPTAERSRSTALFTNGLSETLLAEGASLEARPQLAAGPNGRLALVWNSVSTSGAADAVSLRSFDGTTWGAPRVISRAGRPAFTPSVAFTPSGGMLVVWAEAQVDPDPAGLSVPYAQSLEIAWAEFNPVGTVRGQGLLTNDTVLDFAPRLSAAADGSLWLAWQHSPATNLVGTAAQPNQLRAATWDGSAWGSIETAGANSFGTLFWDVVAADAERLWLAADVDMDGNLTTATDREIYLYQRTAAGWAAPRRLTNDTVVDSGPLLARSPTGELILAWRHDRQVFGLVGDPTTTQPQSWFDASANISPMLGAGELLVAPDGTRSLLWAEGTATGQDLWLAHYDPVTKRWNTPVPLFADAQQRRTPSAAMLPDGTLMVGLAAAPVITTSVQFEGVTAPVPSIDEHAKILVASIPVGGLGIEQRVYLPLLAR
ncbi:MAG: hypothetical protein AB4911_04395 [Oscillochloridaceae bacterium umkhey_bin13]